MPEGKPGPKVDEAKRLLDLAGKAVRKLPASEPGSPPVPPGKPAPK